MWWTEASKQKKVSNLRLSERFRKAKDPDEIIHQDLFCEPAGIQTPSLLIRSQMLYSVKLQAL